MSNKAISIYFVVFAVLYIIYTAIIAGHGIHQTNVIITVTVLALAVYYYLKDRKKISKRKGVKRI